MGLIVRTSTTACLSAGQPEMQVEFDVTCGKFLLNLNAGGTLGQTAWASSLYGQCLPYFVFCTFYFVLYKVQ